MMVVGNGLVFAADDCVVEFEWTPNTETNLAGYKIYYGVTHNGPYDSVVDVGNPVPVDGKVNASVSGLTAGVTYYFVATAYDDQGMESAYSVEDVYTCPSLPDVTPPSGTLTINGGAASTESAVAGLSLAASDAEGTVTEMQFSNDGVVWSNPEAYSTQKSWTLSAGLGMKTVYARFKDGAGNWSENCSDSIELVEGSGESSTKVFGNVDGADFPGTIQDTYINVNNENNYASSNLNTYTWPVDSVANAIVMKFNLSSLPADAQIQSAILSVYMNGVDDGGGDDLYDVSVHKVVNHNPDLSRCNGYTYDGSNGWTPNDACYNNVPMAQADIAPAEDSNSINKTYGYKSWNITNMVREWVQNPAANYGLLLNSDSTASSGSNRTFASSEATDPGQRPKLIITYSVSGGGSVPADTTPPAPPSGLDVH